MYLLKHVSISLGALVIGLSSTPAFPEAPVWQVGYAHGAPAQINGNTETGATEPGYSFSISGNNFQVVSYDHHDGIVIAQAKNSAVYIGHDAEIAGSLLLGFHKAW